MLSRQKRIVGVTRVYWSDEGCSKIHIIIENDTKHTSCPHEPSIRVASPFTFERAGNFEEHPFDASSTMLIQRRQAL